MHAFTDGACLGNPGPGGWGALLRWQGYEARAVGEPLTTNNRMELTAAIAALDALKRPSQVCMHTDSLYVRDGVTRWLPRWKQNGWRTAAKQPSRTSTFGSGSGRSRPAPGGVALGTWSCRPSENERADETRKTSARAARADPV